ncbi:MAG: cupin domain-containing protein [Bacteroidales bacterium]|nr:cupin domain-containing protein [Bacteroidales bacterium]
MEPNVFETGKTFSFSEKVDYSAGGIVSKKVIQKENGNVTLFAFDEGQKLSEHTAPFDALVQVLDGEAEIVINGNPNLLKAGQSIIMPGGIPHAVNAIKPFKMLLIMIRNLPAV